MFYDTPQRDSMSKFQINACKLLAQKHFPITDATRIVIMQQPLTSEQARAREFVANSSATVSAQQTVTAPILRESEYRFAYMPSIDTLYVGLNDAPP